MSKDTLVRKLFFGFFVIIPVALLGETTDTVFIKDVPTVVPAETVRTVQTVVETVKTVVDTSANIKPQVTQPTKEIKTGKVYEVQIGAFANKENADKLYKTLEAIYSDKVYVDNIQSYWKVRIKQYRSWKEAVPIREELLNRGYKDAWIVRSGK